MTLPFNSVVDFLPCGPVKRKRDFCGDAMDLVMEDRQDAKKWKSGLVETECIVSPDAVMEEKPAVKTSQIQEAIESQFSLEILLKHNELRLINQELAKCQVALEQLRRCHLIPYSTSPNPSQSMSDISNGSGPAVQQRAGAPVPQWAPPYGVADGPYTRHYAKWLIPDPSFDGESVQWYHGVDASRAGKSLPEGRTTRHSFADGSTPIGKAGRIPRGSGLQRQGPFQSLSSGYPQPKEKAGPCTLKRGDGQMVKLVCIDCQRENFSSTQGFINHCRIAHRRDFKSHEEAAVASGHPIEVDELGGIVGEEKTPTVATGLVHPLIRDTPADKEAYKAVLSRIEASLALYRQGNLPGVTSIPGVASTPQTHARSMSTPSQNFVPSSETPHLSALMRSRGFDSNLSDIVGEAKTPVDLDELSSHDEESEDSEKRPSQPQRRLGGFDGSVDPSPIPAMRMPARAAMAPAPYPRPGSAKGIDNARVPGISPRPSYATPAINTAAAVSYTKSPSTHMELATMNDVHAVMEIDGPSLIDLSPNTVTSNNAPSLVSDDGEYDDGDDAASASEAEHEEDSDVAEIDIEDGDMEKVVSRTVGNGSKKEGKHVTFVGSVKEQAMARK
ncbi:hypothetical protein BP5796_02391 [Coleophoma crateriformis]|uniref:AHC1-like C2H2 zinc-finger domain-containing protein n=1 Tax=Coleophoma crateriformis TaxID=565419 RepID=A0A3D8SY47_9HELO|nr:hypothetical protein BP5796_02391 [Coleophoma crateriformis]